MLTHQKIEVYFMIKFYVWKYDYIIFYNYKIQDNFFIGVAFYLNICSHLIFIFEFLYFISFTCYLNNLLFIIRNKLYFFFGFRYMLAPLSSSCNHKCASVVRRLFLLPYAPEDNIYNPTAVFYLFPWTFFTYYN